MIRGTCLPGYCTHFEVFTDNITSNEELGARISAGENYIGVIYGYSNDVIYFLTTLSVDGLKSYFQSQYAARNARYGILSVGIGIGGEYYSGSAEFGVSDHRDYGF